MSGTSVRAALARILGSRLPMVEDLELLLGAEEETDVRSIVEAADAVRKRLMGDGILLRGIVEFSSFCSNSCFYCGLHGGNARAARYRMSGPEIIASVDAVAAQDIRTVVLQSGEDGGMDARWLAGVVREIKKRHDMAVTLSVGERPYDEYALWREAGADRFLLKIESSDPDMYRAMHAGRALETRLRCLRDLDDLGYQVGSGIMVGLPGQTLRHIASDILFFAEKDFDMIGIGPFIPHPGTRFHGAARGDAALALRVVALTRIVTRNSHLPATTAFAGLDRDWRPDCLQAGANVLMPNFTPAAYKKMYEIYPGKARAGLRFDASRFGMEALANKAGRTIDRSRGDTLKARTGSPRTG